MAIHAALQSDRHSGFGFFPVNMSKKYCSAKIWSMHQFFHFYQVTTFPALHLCAAKSHVKVVLPQRGYLWWLTSSCTESPLRSCRLARTSCSHNSSWNSSSDSKLMEEVAHKLSKTSGAGIYVSLQVEDLKTSAHSMNFTKMAHLEFFNKLGLVKRKTHIKLFCSFILKNQWHNVCCCR